MRAGTETPRSRLSSDGWYRVRGFGDEVRQLLIGLARFLLEGGHVDRFRRLEAELAKVLKAGSPEVRELLAAAREHDVPLEALAALEEPK